MLGGHIHRPSAKGTTKRPSIPVSSGRKEVADGNAIAATGVMNHHSTPMTEILAGTASIRMLRMS